jgi:hypothetical protein
VKAFQTFRKDILSCLSHSSTEAVMTYRTTLISQWVTVVAPIKWNCFLKTVIISRAVSYCTCTRAVCKVRGLTLLLRVGPLWRCGDGLFFEVPPLASNALLTTLHPLLENVLQTVDHAESSCLGASFSWLKKPRNRMGRDLNWILRLTWKKWISGTTLEHPLYSPNLALCDFWVVRIMKRKLWGKKFRSDERSAARFREVGGAL